MIRITGGTFRGRMIKSPHGRFSRPTLDTVREALFNIIGNDLTGIRFLDLYAGVGLVGIEALSRGAAEAVFVEKVPALVNTLKENLKSLHVENRAKLYQGNVLAYLPRLTKTPFDVIFLDPPYESDEGEIALAKLGYDELPQETLVIRQHHCKTNPKEKIGLLKQTRSKRYGETSLTFYKVSASH